MTDSLEHYSLWRCIWWNIREIEEVDSLKIHNRVSGRIVIDVRCDRQKFPTDHEFIRSRVRDALSRAAYRKKHTIQIHYVMTAGECVRKTPLWTYLKTLHELTGSDAP